MPPPPRDGQQENATDQSSILSDLSSNTPYNSAPTQQSRRVPSSAGRRRPLTGTQQSPSKRVRRHGTLVGTQENEPTVPDLVMTVDSSPASEGLNLSATADNPITAPAHSEDLNVPPVADRHNGSADPDASASPPSKQRRTQTAFLFPDKRGLCEVEEEIEPENFDDSPLNSTPIAEEDAQDAYDQLFSRHIFFS